MCRGVIRLCTGTGVAKSACYAGVGVRACVMSGVIFHSHHFQFLSLLLAQRLSGQWPRVSVIRDPPGLTLPCWP